MTPEESPFSVGTSGAGEPFLRIRTGPAPDSPELHLSAERVGQLRRFLADHHREFRPGKDWSACPYAGHCDDCDCRGMGGDR